MDEVRRHPRDVVFAVIFSWPMRLLLAALVSVLLLWAFREPLLRQAGRYLITEDPPQQVEALYVLGGASVDRGTKAAEIMAEGLAPVAYFTGENIPTVFQAEGIERTEAAISRDAAVRAGLDPALTALIELGTSTHEEADAVLAHARAKGYTNIMVLSSSFHLRRIKFTFRQRFRREGINVVLRAAPSLQFDEDRWWESEDGLLMVNNEYTKLVYYWLKY